MKNVIFQKRLELVHRPTKISKLTNLSKTLGTEISIWRDDLTGFVESGNKIRKLEFLLADAIDKGCNTIITCGGIQSNHTRTTTVAARKFGMEVVVLVSHPDGEKILNSPTSGNLLLNRIFGAKFKFIDPQELKSAGSFDPFLELEATKLSREGRKPYIIPLGGSNPIGCLGYLTAIEEMLDLWKQCEPSSSGPDSIFCAVGSGATHAGLVLGLREFNHPRTSVYGISSGESKTHFENTIRVLLSNTAKQFSVKLENVDVERVTVFDDYIGEGYGVATDSELKFYIDFARSEGILLDPCYTGKAFNGMISELKKNPGRYGKKILFLHSGGVFANFAYERQCHGLLSNYV